MVDHNLSTLSHLMFKDASPLNTVKRIKELLNQHGIKTVEEWNESGVPYCYSMRVSVFGTTFGTNGKGITKEFAMASAYGELMERLQLGSVLKGDRQKDGSAYTYMQSNIFMPAKDLLARNAKWYTFYADEVERLTGVKLAANELLDQYCDKNGNVSVTPFYCVNTHTEEFLPTELLRTIYTSNGCAAGNTIEEALVQAISEIQERHISQYIMTEKIAVPDVSEDVLRSCETEYKIISFLREQGFKVIIKDCSLGKKFPVICAVLIDETTGKYHTHFGAYPNFRIALQRTLTETFQGRNIQKIARFDSFQHVDSGKFDLANLLNQLVRGESEKKPEFFLPAVNQDQELCGLTGTSNKELLLECLDLIVEQGYDILVRDYSCLGFDTYQVIVPGYSEIFTHRLVPDMNDLRYRRFAQPVLRNPSAASIEQIMGYMMDMLQMQKKKLKQKNFSAQANLPAQLSATEEQYLLDVTMASLNYTLGRNTEVLRYIEKILTGKSERDIEKLVCVKRYLTLQQNHYNEETIHSILNYFHRPMTVRWLYDMLAKKENLFDPFTLHCDMQCQPSCLLHGACLKKQTDVLVHLIQTRNGEMSQYDMIEKLQKLYPSVQ